MEKYWNRIKSALKDTIPLHTYRMWIKPLTIRRDDIGGLIIECPNAFSLRRVQEHYSQQIQKEIKRLTGQTCRFGIADGCHALPARDAVLAVEPQLTLPEINRQVNAGRYLRRDFTFDQFVVGRNNDFAFSASLALASSRHAA